MQFSGEEMNAGILMECVGKHRNQVFRYNRLEDYYCGRHDILYRNKQGELSPNNRIVCNFAKYITDTAVGYAFGNPIRYKFREYGEEMAGFLFRAGIQTHDSELAKDLSVFGNGFELVYTDGVSPKIALIDPRYAFVVHDDTVAQEPVYGVVYGYEGGGERVVYRVYSREKVEVYSSKGFGGLPELESVSPNLLGMVQLIEYKNNEEKMGDFEHVLTLIDAYNTLQSDRLNDKERFVDSVLLIQGCQLPDDESASKMISNRILELPFDNADAKYLTKVMNESETEILRKAIAEDIHKFSQTPDFSDEHFSGNTSGVAIKYKLLSIENLAKVKERFFVEGAKGRILLAERIMKALGVIKGDAGLVDVSFNRSLPINEYELAQTISTLHGIVPEEELLKRWR